MAFKGVFFDLGGTLFSYSGRLGSAGIAHVVRTLRLDAAPEAIGAAWGVAAAEVGERYGKDNYFLHKDLFQDTLRLFLDGFGLQASPQLAEEFHQLQLEAVVTNLPIRADCHSTLAGLRAKGIYVSIVSNIDDDYLDPLVTNHGLDKWLDDWTSSEEAQSCKPHAGIYHHALSKSGLKLQEVLFVGDSLHHDVAGAAAIGMPSARIVEPGVKTPLTHGLEVTAEPDYEIAELTDLLDLVLGVHD
ncbi:HAD family hydrolase [Halieaceae bacterium IMCC14734]|uniref:HAD family hydrolase n=1 Tax=Candidatus Litorirhabdus singularis TaxID=2518993 RepID=A0ABT3TFD3_9GAMM|nr:HAD family hydrolase [Candidatus Litorirhabdus singularis]MCX2980910.1 HAD family hydrolase [Candidatus Litorirhabdus singularis]